MSRAGLLSDQQVDIIATRLAERLSVLPASQNKVTTTRTAPVIVSHTELGEGVFANVDDAVEAAGIAYRELDGMSLEGRQKITVGLRLNMQQRLLPAAPGQAVSRVVQDLFDAAVEGGPLVHVQQLHDTAPALSTRSW